jgi:hypothetical protein
VVERPLVRPKCGSEDNINIDVREIGLRIGTSAGL